ncbi:MAG: FAD-binding protein [Deltaproteobacteria bacterium]|nr:FAD-binding protein [Deltaproteobacteria bacterium]
MKGSGRDDVRFDRVTRQIYSTDASMYQMDPLGVVFPRHADDVQAIVETAGRHMAPVLPRGGGTSLAGQCVGEAVVLDFSPRMNKVLELNLEEKWVRVQPGVVQDQLNAFLAPHGYGFGPDTSTSNRATIGGMAGNDSSGARSLVYGMTHDHTIETRVVLSDSSLATFGPLDLNELEAKLRMETLEGHIYRIALKTAEANRDEIEKRLPRIQRRVSGYKLDELLGKEQTNLARLMVGSEGTLAVITELKMGIIPLPKMKALLVAQFTDMIKAVEADNLILGHGPAAMELVDDTIINEALASPAFRGGIDFLHPKTGGLIIVEFHGDTAAELEDRLAKLEADLKRNKMGHAYVRAMTAPEQARVWSLRKAGLGLLMGHRSEAKPLPFVEDTAVDPARLADYLKDFSRLISRHGLKAGYYGHASVGCLHIRPFIDLKQPDGKEKMMSIFNEVADLVAHYGGTVAGEHGDGLARSWLIEKMYGSKLYQAFREIKSVFDPNNIMNPGKIVDAPGPMENLRWGVPVKNPIKTFLDFNRDGGYAFAVEMCNGNGNCRKLDQGTMCPSFQVTRQDRHSTRGRANALRGILHGSMDSRAYSRKGLHQVMELCLECKACKTECPSKVDMAKFKYEFLHSYHRTHGVPLRSRIFARVEQASRLASALAPFSNWIINSPINRWLMARIGITSRRKLQTFTRKRFSRWFARRKGPAPAVDSAGREPQEVVFFLDTFVEYNTPSLGRDTLEILEKAGCRVIIPERKCCGRPMISKGLLDEARENARFNIAVLKPYAERGLPIVGVEPSCILAIRDDYRDLVPGPDADLVASQALTIDEFLARLCDEGRLSFPGSKAPDGGPEKREILLHGHCHQKALVGTGPTLKVLRSIPGAKVSEINSGCCGMAGSFGYESEHYEISMAIGEQRLFPAVRGAGPEATVVADGMSCRQQISHGTGHKSRHLVEVVAEALRD